MEVASGRYFKNPPQTLRRIIVLVYAKAVRKNTLKSGSEDRRNHTIQAESEVNSREIFAAVQNSHMIHQVINKKSQTDFVRLV